MAYALSRDDRSVLEEPTATEAIRIVSKGIAHPKEFWPWVAKEAKDQETSELVDAARRAFQKGGWPWDKACIQAGAYLAVTAGIPPVAEAPPSPVPFPYWSAIDKHTDRGREALGQVAAEVGVSGKTLSQLCFYFQGAKTNSLASSPWWEREKKWRLSSLGLTLDKAKDLWMTAGPKVKAHLADYGKELEWHVQQPIPLGTPDEPSLFDY